TAAGLCPSDTGCSGHELHAGAAAQFHPAPEAAFDPWIGLVLGYATRRLFEKSPQWGDVRGTFSGPEMGIETGLAFRMASAMQIGPFVALGLSRYRGSASSVSGSRGGQSFSEPINRGWSDSV